MRAQVANIELGGGVVRICWIEAGQGPLVLLVHGWIHSAAVWREVTPHLLRSGHSICAVDLPGFGSSPPPPAHLLGLRGYAAVLAGFVTQAVKSPVSALVADSLGARVALEMLASEGGAVCERAILSGCPFNGLPAGVEWVQR